MGIKGEYNDDEKQKLMIENIKLKEKIVALS